MGTAIITTDALPTAVLQAIADGKDPRGQECECLWQEDMQILCDFHMGVVSGYGLAMAVLNE